MDYQRLRTWVEKVNKEVNDALQQWSTQVPQWISSRRENVSTAADIPKAMREVADRLTKGNSPAS